MEGLPALDELLTSRLLLETDDPNRPYRFTHDKIRDVVYTEAGNARRRIFHRRAFEALEAATAAYPEPLIEGSILSGVEGRLSWLTTP